MATHKSAEKRNRQNKTHRLHNQTIKAAVRSALKKSRVAAEEKNTGLAKEELRNAEKLLASAAAKGIFHKKNAARKVSRLAKLINKQNA